MYRKNFFPSGELNKFHWGEWMMIDKKNLVVVFAVILLLAGSGVGAEQVDDLLQQGRNAYFEGDYQQAENLFRELKDRGEYVWEANFYLGMIYLQQDQLEEAEKYMQQAYDMAPEDYFTLVNYARILYREGHLEQAGEMLNRVPEDKRTISESYYNTRGLLAMAGEKHEEAIDYFLQAVEINPENYYVLNNLGLALIRTGEFQEAKEYLEKAVEQDPQEAFIYNNLGIAYENLNQLEDARDSYERAVELNHPQAEANLNRVISRLED